MKDAAPYGASVVNGHLFFKLLDGSTISCNCIGEPYASRVVAACRNAEAAEVANNARKAIADYDEREAKGEDVSGEIRPRLPGGSDW